MGLNPVQCCQGSYDVTRSVQSTSDPVGIRCNRRGISNVMGRQKGFNVPYSSMRPPQRGVIAPASGGLQPSLQTELPGVLFGKVLAESP